MRFFCAFQMHRALPYTAIVDHLIYNTEFEFQIFRGNFCLDLSKMTSFLFSPDQNLFYTLTADTIMDFNPPRAGYIYDCDLILAPNLQVNAFNLSIHS